MTFRIVHALRLALAIGALTGIARAAADQAEKSPGVESMRQVVTEWSKVRAETVRLEEDWRSERELLTSTQRALQEQVARLANEKKVLEASTAAERDSLAELAAANAAAQASLKSAGQRLEAMGAQLVALRPCLPPRLSQALELPYRSLANPALGPTERMQHVTTLLNRCTQFDRTISYGEELLAVPGEPEGKMFEVIYWGVSHGYALDRTAGRAYFGSPGPQGWAWEPIPEQAAQVVRLIAIYRDKGDPVAVAVPARITDPLPN